jgi:predicted methyltransferase
MTARLTESAHEAVRGVIRPGEFAVDATAGNGRDTRFLAELVGPTGHVFSLDIQPEALARTAVAVRGTDNVTLLLRDHRELRDVIPESACGRVAAVMFNLGYLPGASREVRTRPESTLRGITAALGLLRPGGVLTVLAYTGHTGGREEADAVAGFLASLTGPEFRASEPHATDRPAHPRLFVVHKSFDPG